MRRLGVILIVLAVGVVVATVLGPLAGDVIRYHVVDDMRNQIMGGDAVGLFLVTPAAMTAGVLALRRHPAGPIMALAVAGYAVYTYTQLAAGGEFATQPGNSERFFPVFLTIVVLAGAALVLAWTSIDDRDLPTPSPSLRRTAVTVLFAVAVFLTFGLHLPGLVDVVGGPPNGVEYTQSPTVFWIVKLMDLGIVVPLAIVTGIGVLRGVAWARRLMYGVVGWGALLGSAVAGMGVVMVARDDPAASLPATVVFVALASALLIIAGGLLRPLFTAERPVPRPDRRQPTDAVTGDRASHS